MFSLFIGNEGIGVGWVELGCNMDNLVLNYKYGDGYMN